MRLGETSLFGEPDDAGVFKVPGDLNLDRRLKDFMAERECHPMTRLDETESFLGRRIGVYLIYYRGTHPLYEPVSALNRDECLLPIYVGKAVPEGARSGNMSGRAEALAKRGLAAAGSSVFKRLREHRDNSLARVDNLELDDFLIRAAPMEVDLAAWGESLLLRHFQPVWNRFVLGFGIHDPGKGRKDQQRSVWDTLHVGRAVGEDRPPNTRADVFKLGPRIEEHCEKMRERLGLRYPS